MKDERCFVVRELRLCNSMRNGAFCNMRDGSDLAHPNAL